MSGHQRLCDAGIGAASRETELTGACTQNTARVWRLPARPLPSPAVPCPSSFITGPWTSDLLCIHFVDSLWCLGSKPPSSVLLPAAALTAWNMTWPMAGAW